MVFAESNGNPELIEMRRRLSSKDKREQATSIDKEEQKLEVAKGVADTFIKTPKGFKTTNVEGFVAIDKVGKAVKLVDRLEFAHQNFTAAENWTK